LLLPCNVVVRCDPEHQANVIVEAMDPQVMVKVADEPGLGEIADDATERLQAAIDTLGTQRLPS
jgi:hypothetical protein